MERDKGGILGFGILGTRREGPRRKTSSDGNLSTEQAVRRFADALKQAVERYGWPMVDALAKDYPQKRAGLHGSVIKSQVLAIESMADELAALEKEDYEHLLDFGEFIYSIKRR